MSGWWMPDDLDQECSDPPQLEVDDVPNEAVAVLLGPDGEAISTLYERPVVLMGFQSHPKTVSRIVRAEGWR